MLVPTRKVDLAHGSWQVILHYPGGPNAPLILKAVSLSAVVRETWPRDGRPLPPPSRCLPCAGLGLNPLLIRTPAILDEAHLVATAC